MAASPIPLRVLVFDLDDTLYPEQEFVFCGFDAVVSAHRDLLGADAAQRLREIYRQGNRTRTFNQILLERGIDDATRHLDALVRTYRLHVPTIRLFPDAEAALTHWSPCIATAILSDGYLQTQRNKIAALGLERRVNCIVLTDEWGRAAWKPSPSGFVAIEQRLHASGAACAYVADNPGKDFVAPNQLGWTSVRIWRPGGVYGDAEAALGGEPQHVIDSLDQLTRLFTPCA